MIDLKTVWRKNKPVYFFFLKTSEGDVTMTPKKNEVQCADKSGWKLNLR